MRLAALAIIVLLAPTAAADWLQAHHDAANTAASDEPGPRHAEVAWTVQLPGSRAGYQSPLIIGHAAYVLTADFGFDGLREEALWTIDLDDPTPRKLLDLPGYPSAFSSDGERLFVSRDLATEAYTLEGQGPLWSVRHPRQLPQHDVTVCLRSALVDGLLFVGCDEVAAMPRPASVELTTATTAATNVPSVVGFVLAIDAGTGELRWSWTKPVTVAPSAPDPQPFWALNEVVVIAGTIYVVTQQLADENGVGDFTLWALDAQTGKERWHRTSEATTRGVAQTTACEAGALPPPCAGAATGIYVPSGTSTLIFTRWEGAAQARSAATGNVVWSLPIGRADLASGGDATSHLALFGGDFIIQSGQTLYRLPATETQPTDPRWTLTLATDAGFAWAPGLAVAEDLVYARSCRIEPPHACDLHGVDAHSGEHRWNLTLLDPHPTPFYVDRMSNRWFDFGIADGVLVVAGRTGEVTAIGRTAASIDARADVRSAYPAPGETVRVDLGGSGPGRGGAPTWYAADWGDGTVPERQDSPVFEHAYTTSGDHAARFTVGNDAGQTSVVALTFHVGAPEPNLLSEAFRPENQDLTFFVVGLAVTAAGALFGLGRVQRRRRLLQRELAAADRVAEALRARPPALDRALGEHALRAHALLLAGKLDEAQYGVLKTRIEHLTHQAREGVVDERLRFLPHGLAQSLREILADGRVTRLEREHFEAALAAEGGWMTPEQKAEARRIVDEWFRRDSGQ